MEPNGFQTLIICVDLYHNKEIMGGHRDLPSPVYFEQTRRQSEYGLAADIK